MGGLLWDIQVLYRRIGGKLELKKGGHLEAFLSAMAAEDAPCDSHRIGAGRKKIPEKTIWPAPVIFITGSV